ncbi:hypothetical protein AV540_10170 [Brevibacillus parabrevis]|uniref:hypothetical protein n=1 Tax=Brevibacillus parabrevis TaxID=54914 RepID=UPI0007AB58D6|nr:hypothetical protein [Brevibacillus parabrevis]KZE52231.1 hypothetical protein AV540_10170 [Brevibacillus parabrevis]
MNLPRAERKGASLFVLLLHERSNDPATVYPAKGVFSRVGIQRENAALLLESCYPIDNERACLACE